jgi:hypothetical protein
MDVMVNVIMLSVITLSFIMLSVVMLSIVMLSVIMLSVVMLNAIMLSVVAPTYCFYLTSSKSSWFNFIKLFGRNLRKTLRKIIKNVDIVYPNMCVHDTVIICLAFGAFCARFGCKTF